MNNRIVGEDIILPRSLRSQNALPSAPKTKIYINSVGTVRPCNKLPTVQCRIGHRCISVYCPKARLTLASP